MFTSLSWRLGADWEYAFVNAPICPDPLKARVLLTTLVGHLGICFSLFSRCRYSLLYFSDTLRVSVDCVKQCSVWQLPIHCLKVDSEQLPDVVYTSEDTLGPCRKYLCSLFGCSHLQVYFKPLCSCYSLLYVEGLCIP